MEILFIGIITLFCLEYNNKINTTKFLRDNEQYFQILKEERYDFLVKAKHGEEINPDDLFSPGTLDKFGTISPQKAKSFGWVQEDADAWLRKPVTIIMPAALGSAVHNANVNEIDFNKVKIYAESANTPTTPGADKIIREKGIYVIPDFLCNAGGVTVSYFEQVQNNMNYYWPKEEVLEKLDRVITSAFTDVDELAKKENLYPREAAYMIAVKRVADAVEGRGWIRSCKLK